MRKNYINISRICILTQIINKRETSGMMKKLRELFTEADEMKV